MIEKLSRRNILKIERDNDKEISPNTIEKTTKKVNSLLTSL